MVDLRDLPPGHPDVPWGVPLDGPALDAQRHGAAKGVTRTPSDLLFPEGIPARVFRAWLTGVRNTLHGHGSDLVDQLGAAGVTDNVARAETLLRYALSVGWLVQGSRSPTREQRFFDVSGDDQRRGWVTSNYGPPRWCATVEDEYGRLWIVVPPSGGILHASLVDRPMSWGADWEDPPPGRYPTATEALAAAVACTSSPGTWTRNPKALHEADVRACEGSPPTITMQAER